MLRKICSGKGLLFSCVMGGTGYKLTQIQQSNSTSKNSRYYGNQRKDNVCTQQHWLHRTVSKKK